MTKMMRLDDTRTNPTQSVPQRTATPLRPLHLGSSHGLERAAVHLEARTESGTEKMLTRGAERQALAVVVEDVANPLDSGVMRYPHDDETDPRDGEKYSREDAEPDEDQALDEDDEEDQSLNPAEPDEDGRSLDGEYEYSSDGGHECSYDDDNWHPSAWDYDNDDDDISGYPSSVGLGDGDDYYLGNLFQGDEEEQSDHSSFPSLHEDQPTTTADDEAAAFYANTQKPENDEGTVPKVVRWTEVRQANLGDVVRMRNCDKASSGKDLGLSFYGDFIEEWPELSLVAELVSSPAYEPYRSEQNKERKFIGYVFGTVKETSLKELMEQRPVATNKSAQQPPPKRIYGHVVSLAVGRLYRRKGVATSLMERLHDNMRLYYGADSSGLHVRASDHAAMMMGGAVGYRYLSLVRDHYGSTRGLGEDAFFMIKHFFQDGKKGVRTGAEEKKEVF